MSPADLRQLYRRWMLELWNGDLAVPGATAPAGTPVAFGGIDLLRARDGQFAEYWVSSDGLQLMVQLGALGPGA
ncbi:MAG TPA: hypothetical protein VIJ32_13220 [Actinomycetes bacterium]|jgi:hypothetical protein